MNHQEIRRQLGQHLVGLLADQSHLPLTLRPYQVETLESAVRWLEDPNGTKRCYVSHATGLGKTVLFASMTTAAAGMRTLIIVPTKALLEQTARVLSRFTGGVLGHLSSLAHISDDAGETIAMRGMEHSAIVLTTDASFNKLAPKIRAEFDPHLILREECHWGYVGSALAGLNEFPEAVIIGFSATPDFLTSSACAGFTPVTLDNGQVMYGPRDKFAETHFEFCLDRRTIRWGIENGWLAPLAWGRVEFDVEMDKIPVVDGPNGPDYEETELQRMMGKHWPVMCETIRRLYESHEYDLHKRQAFAVCPNVAAAEELAKIVGSLGIPTACITGNTPDLERNIILRAYRDDEIRFLTSVMVLREGWDAPNAEVCMMLRPTKSKAMYEQPMGRVLRLREDGEHKVALVLDAYFQSSKLLPLSAPDLYAPPGSEIPVGDILMGPRDGVGGGEIDSPYLPKNAQPKIVIVQSFDDDAIEHHAGPDGIAIIEGKPMATIATIASLLGVSHGSVSQRVRNVKITMIRGRDRGGKKVSLYSIEEAKIACNDLIEKLPQADDDGLLRIGTSTYATTKKLGELFGKDQATIKTHVERKKLPFVRGRDRLGRVAQFYDIDVVRNACSEMLEALPTIGVELESMRDGTFLHNGIPWGTVNVFMGILKLSRRAIRGRLEKANCESIRVRDQLGRVFQAYRLKDARSACRNLLTAKLKPGDNGFVDFNGRRYGHSRSIALDLGVSSTYIASLIQKHRPLSISAKNKAGRITDYYDLEVLRSIAKEKVETNLSLKPDGSIVIDNVLWVSRMGAVKLLKIGYSSINKRLEKNPMIESKKAIDTSGHVVQIYRLEELRALCSSMLQERPILGQDGNVLIDGRAHTTIPQLMKLFRKGEARIWSRIAKAHLNPKSALLPKINRPVDVFCIEDVQRAIR